mmetsp:Transcript_55598/g.140693  ORF Transcript_55598/g.140693 Transcript_55598/m.140693 type:complete len:211 (+) Transcript_55598:220-852(+)
MPGNSGIHGARHICSCMDAHASRAEVAALLGEVSVPRCQAGEAAVALRFHQAGGAARAAEDLVETELQRSNLRDRGHVDALLLLLGRRPHAVPEAVLVQDLLEAHLANPVALVDDQLANALRPDLHHVQPPAVSLRQLAAPRQRRNATATEQRHRGDVPSHQCQASAESQAGDRGRLRHSRKEEDAYRHGVETPQKWTPGKHRGLSQKET